MTEFTSHSVQETEQFAAHCAAKLRAGDVLACRGGMGMGKTAFARGLARGLGLSDEVSSPTFALVQDYTHGPLPLFHFDLYRIRDVYDLESTGFYDYLDRGGVLFIEWSENAAGALPPETICVCFERIDDDTRLIMLEGGPF